MQRKQTKPARGKWNEEDAEKSLVEIAGRNSIRKTTAKYGRSEGIYATPSRQAGNLNSVGRPITIDKGAEQVLASEQCALLGLVQQEPRLWIWSRTMFVTMI